MATKKRKSTKRRTAARRKKAEQRLPAGLGTLFGGLLLMVLAFVQGDSVWRRAAAPRTAVCLCRKMEKNLVLYGKLCYTE